MAVRVGVGVDCALVAVFDSCGREAGVGCSTVWISAMFGSLRKAMRRGRGMKDYSRAKVGWCRSSRVAWRWGQIDECGS